MHRLTPLLLAACTAAPATPSLADALGLTAALGAARVTDRVDADGATTWAFDPDSGPRCLRGDPFQMATRDVASEDLVIFLQGGGACWSGFCFAVTRAQPGVPSVDVLRQDLPENPVRDWDVAYVPYCDGSLFAGDRDHDDDGDGATDRWHRGLRNLSAALDATARTFPHPRRVLFAGSSGGGLGALFTLPLVRHVFPDAALFVIADSGAGVARGAADPGFVERLVDEFGAERFLPPDCPDCLGEGHVAPLVDVWLSHLPDVRVGVFSSWYDAILGDIFLDVDPSAFRDDLAAETGRTQAAFPDRYHRFLVDGRVHTALLGDPSGIIGTDLGAVEIPPEAFARLSALELGSLTRTGSQGRLLSDWIGAMLDGDASWEDVVDVPGPPPG